MKQPVESRQLILDRIRSATPSAAGDASQLADAYEALPAPTSVAALYPRPPASS